MNLQSHAEKYLLHKTAKRSLFALINNNSNVKLIIFKKLSVTIFRKTTKDTGGKTKKTKTKKNEEAITAASARTTMEADRHHLVLSATDLPCHLRVRG